MLFFTTQEAADDSKEFVDAGKLEARILDEVRHPNIVRVISAWESSKAYHVAMEYAPRGDAFDIVDFYDGGCPEPLAGKVAEGLFSALAHIHAKGIVHHDVKPENLFLKDSGDAVLGDFGLARKIPGGPDGTMPARSPCGTSTYVVRQMNKGVGGGRYAVCNAVCNQGSR
jgi:serine/threonine protein kinase